MSEDNHEENGMTKIRKNSHPIHVGKQLRALMKKRKKQPLSSVVNMIADRYTSMISHGERVPPYPIYRDMYMRVLKEHGKPLTGAEVALFPAMCEDYCRRHPDFAPACLKICVLMLKDTDYFGLMKLVDMIETQL